MDQTLEEMLAEQKELELRIFQLENTIVEEKSALELKLSQLSTAIAGSSNQTLTNVLNELGFKSSDNQTFRKKVWDLIIYVDVLSLYLSVTREGVTEQEEFFNDTELLDFVKNMKCFAYNIKVTFNLTKFHVGKDIRENLQDDMNYELYLEDADTFEVNTLTLG